MQTYFNVFIKEIKDETDISLSIFSSNGEYLAGEKSIAVVPFEFDGIYTDEKSNLTLFKVLCKNKTYIFAISGISEVQKNYAVFISALAKNFFKKGIKLNKEDFIKASALGELTNVQIREDCKKFAINDGPCFAVIAKTNGKVEEVLSVFNTIAGETLDGVFSVDENTCALIKFSPNGFEEYRSVGEFAEFLLNAVYEETGIAIKLYYGKTVASFCGVALSFSQAVFASEMDAFNDSNLEVHSFKEFVLEKMLNELPKAKLNEYLDLLIETGKEDVFSDEEIVSTAEGFLDNDLNVSETSRKLFLHRNTLIYRLDKIERSTGLDVRKFSDALTFKLINLLNKLVK
jgi:carbohydrate diacid regulator